LNGVHAFQGADARFHLCGSENVWRDLLDEIESLHAKAGPSKVSSACRCPKHPVEARKPKPGFHTKSLAADLVPVAMPLRAFS